jgi:hypothetical protein
MKTSSKNRLTKHILAIFPIVVILGISALQVRATTFACYVNSPPHALDGPGEVRIVRDSNSMPDDWAGCSNKS